MELNIGGADGVNGTMKSNGNYTIRLSDTHLQAMTLTLSVVSESAGLIGEFPDVRNTLPWIALAAAALFLYAVWAYTHYISHPMDALVEAAEHMEAGERGYLVAYTPKSREFTYLTDRFNSMSTQLKYQFERSYQEQLALAGCPGDGALFTDQPPFSQ